MANVRWKKLTESGVRGVKKGARRRRQRFAWFAVRIGVQPGVLQVVRGVFGMKSGRVVCAEVAERG